MVVCVSVSPCNKAVQVAVHLYRPKTLSSGESEDWTWMDDPSHPYRLLSVASEGRGQLLPVVPPPGSDGRFLLSVTLALTEPPDRTGQPALPHAHTHMEKSFMFYLSPSLLCQLF